MKTIKLIITHIFFIAILISFSACEDLLDINPKDNLTTEAAVATAANIENLLIGNYNLISRTESYGGDLNLASELIANSGELNWSGTFSQPREFDNKNILTDNSFVANAWLNAYRVSNQSNIILANLDKFTDTDQKKRIEGEAKFLRGLVYFDLIRFFSQPYLVGVVNSGLGVPIIIEPVTDPNQIEKSSRNTIEEVYTMIINDLSSAYNLLPESNDIFADRYAAQALLARIYLQQGNYVAARDASNNVISNSGHSLTSTYLKAFNNDVDSSEDIFTIQKNSQDPASNLNDMNAFWSNGANGGRGDVNINDPFLNLFQGTDDRATFFYDDNFSNKWKSQFANIPHLRIAEMYLIRAECNQRLLTTIGATPTSDINNLRNRSNALAIAVDLDVILLERRKELAFEGFRLHDIKRLKENVGTLNYNDNKLVFPIPQREIDANTNIEQNPGY